MTRFILMLIVAVTSCATTSPIQFGGIKDPALIVEDKPLPERPDAAQIPAQQDWSIGLLKGSQAPAEGILLSPEKAARAKKWQIEYDRIRGLYELDRQIWAKSRVIYNDRIEAANREIARHQRSWWDENKGTIGLVSGIIIGAAVTVGIVYSVDQVQGD